MFFKVQKYVLILSMITLVNHLDFVKTIAQY